MKVTSFKGQKYSPILFSTPMVQAIMEGRKTMTRRAIAGIPSEAKFQFFFVDSNCKDVARFVFSDGTDKFVHPKCVTGDILWVKEKWCNISKPEYAPEYCYFADNDACEDYDPNEWKGAWKSPRYMPKAAARLFLRVKCVRPEKLQEITEENAGAEGVVGLFPPSQRHKKKETKWVSGHCSECALFDLGKGLAVGPCAGRHEEQKPHDGTSIGCTFGFSLKPDTTHEPAVFRFRCLWDSINDKHGCHWNANPWVWVIEFERIEKPEGWPNVE